MPKDISAQVKEVYRYLRTELEKFSEGERFHTIRELMEQQNFSRRTLDKTLQQMEREGLIRCEPSQGIFVRKRPENKSYHIVYAYLSYPCELAFKIRTAVLDGLRQAGYHASEEIIPHDYQFRDFFARVGQVQADAVMANYIAEYNVPVEEALANFVKRKMVYYDSSLLFPGINLVDFQAEMVGMLAADYLIKRNHKKIALIISEPCSPYGSRMERVNGFINMCRINGIEPQIIDCGIKNGESSQARTADFMYDYLKKHGLTFTACFALSDYSAFGIIRVFDEFHIAIPDEVSIIGYEGNDCGAFSRPTLTSITFDMEEVKSVILAGFHAMFHGGSFGIRKLTPFILERGSVKTISKGKDGWL